MAFSFENCLEPYFVYFCLLHTKQQIDVLKMIYGNKSAKVCFFANGFKIIFGVGLFESLQAKNCNFAE